MAIWATRPAFGSLPQSQATSDDDNDDIDAALNDLQVPINSSCVHLLINTFNKGGKFLKKLWCCIGGGVLQDN